MFIFQYIYIFDAPCNTILTNRHLSVVRPSLAFVSNVPAGTRELLGGKSYRGVEGNAQNDKATPREADIRAAEGFAASIPPCSLFYIFLTRTRTEAITPAIPGSCVYAVAVLKMP